MCLPIPYLIAMPQREGRWLGTDEIAMLLAGGWVLFANLSGLEKTGFFSHITGAKGVRIARIIFGLAVLPVGLSHIVYTQVTASLVPSWLLFRTGLAYLTGFGQMACGLAILFSIWPRAAALIETGMLFRPSCMTKSGVHDHALGSSPVLVEGRQGRVHHDQRDGRRPSLPAKTKQPP
jgi:hypothetical protein